MENFKSDLAKAFLDLGHCNDKVKLWFANKDSFMIISYLEYLILDTPIVKHYTLRVIKIGT